MLKSINFALTILFGCSHPKFSFPLTLHSSKRRNVPAAQLTGTYVACLCCGAEFAYDLKEMKVIYVSPKTAPLVAEKSIC